MATLAVNKPSMTLKPPKTYLAPCYTARSARIGAGMSSIFGFTVPSSAITHILSFLQPGDLQNLNRVCKTWRALFCASPWLEIVSLYAIPIDQFRCLPARFGRSDYKDRKLNVAHDPRLPHQGRVLFTYTNFLSEEVHFNDPTRGYSITEKYTFTGRWHADEIVPLPFKGGYIPFRTMKVIFDHYVHAEFCHSPPSTLKNVLLKEGGCVLSTTFALAVSSEKGKIEMTGRVPDGAKLDPSPIVLKIRDGPDLERPRGRRRGTVPATAPEEPTPPPPANASAFERLQYEMRAARNLTVYKEPEWKCEVKRLVKKGKDDGDP